MLDWMIPLWVAHGSPKVGLCKFAARDVAEAQLRFIRWWWWVMHQVARGGSFPVESTRIPFSTILVALLPLNHRYQGVV